MELLKHIDERVWASQITKNPLHRASGLTVSKALGRSMKTWYRGMFGSVHFACSFLAKNIMSVVLLPGRKPYCIFLILPVDTHVVSACWVIVWPTPYQQFQVVWFHGDLVPLSLNKVTRMLSIPAVLNQTENGWFHTLTPTLQQFHWYTIQTKCITHNDLTNSKVCFYFWW